MFMRLSSFSFCSLCCSSLGCSSLLSLFFLSIDPHTHSVCCVSLELDEANRPDDPDFVEHEREVGHTHTHTYRLIPILIMVITS